MKLKKIILLGLILCGIVIINNQIHSILSLWQKRDLLVKARQELSRQEKEHQGLEDKISLINNPQFVEEEARDKLFLAKPGEGVVIFSKQALNSSVKPKKNVKKDPNWRKWFELFFKK